MLLLLLLATDYSISQIFGVLGFFAIFGEEDGDKGREIIYGIPSIPCLYLYTFIGWGCSRELECTSLTLKKCERTVCVLLLL